MSYNVPSHSHWGLGQFSGGGGGGFIENPGEGVVKKRQSPDLRSPEVGISVTITLFGIYLVNKTIKYDEWRWISLRTVDFYIGDAWKSVFQGKNENIQKLYSIGLWICLSWDFCASSWDHEIVLKTLRLERSALGLGEGCPILWQIYAWHCIVMKILYKSIRIKNKKYNEKLNKAMHKFVGVFDKYGWGEEDMYVPSLNFKYGHFPFWGVGHIPLPSWY